MRHILDIIKAMDEQSRQNKLFLAYRLVRVMNKAELNKMKNTINDILKEAEKTG